MKRARSLIFLSLLVGSGFFLGCISHHETVYSDAPRQKVSFENERAARVFYEALSKKPSKGNYSSSETEVSVPILFEHKTKTVSGENVKFNAAVLKCDTNQDGLITEMEANIYAELR